MESWLKIGTANLEAGKLLYEEKRYRSATSRFYYAAFSVLTHELTSRGAAAGFRSYQQTPSHAQLASLIKAYFAHMTPERRLNLTSDIMQLYRHRLEADYDATVRIDRISATESLRFVESIFRYLEIR